MPNFNVSMLSNLEIPLTSKEIQKKVTNELKPVQREFQNQITLIGNQLFSINKHSSSILNEVFGQYLSPK